MSANVRHDALAVFAELVELAPEVRLGQLMAHLGFLSEDQTDRSIWDIEDDELLTVLHRHRSELLARQHPLPNHATPGAQTVECSQKNPGDPANTVDRAATTAE
jgi:hypothetical protein